jgi:hypothetical protein
MEASFKNARALRLRFSQFLGETATTIKPSDGSFDDPTLGQFHEPFGLIGSLDDFGFEPRQDFSDPVSANRFLIGAVGIVDGRSRMNGIHRGVLLARPRRRCFGRFSRTRSGAHLTLFSHP